MREYTYDVTIRCGSWTKTVTARGFTSGFAIRNALVKEGFQSGSKGEPDANAVRIESEQEN